jgi:hypothetical protein
MAKRQRYHAMKVQCERSSEKRASWKYQMRTVKGTEVEYRVHDGNLDRLNNWSFVVQIPGVVNTPVIVRPSESPGIKTLADVNRRSVVFVACTRHPWRAWRYAKVAPADPTLEQTKKVLRRGERDLLPSWFQYFRSKMRLKRSVTTTAGTDGDALVVCVKRDDHERMIRFFFATKVWILRESLIVKE